VGAVFYCVRPPGRQSYPKFGRLWSGAVHRATDSILARWSGLSGAQRPGRGAFHIDLAAQAIEVVLVQDHKIVADESAEKLSGLLTVTEVDSFSTDSPRSRRHNLELVRDDSLRL